MTTVCFWAAAGMTAPTARSAVAPARITAQRGRATAGPSRRGVRGAVPGAPEAAVGSEGHRPVPLLAVRVERRAVASGPEHPRVVGERVERPEAAPPGLDHALAPGCDRHAAHHREGLAARP